MTYKPYPIYDMRQGKITATDPWLSPQDGFKTLENCYLKFGVLEKRKGYIKYAQLLHINTVTKAPTMLTTPVMGIYNYYTGATKQLIAMSYQRVNLYQTTVSENITITKFANAGGGEVTVTAGTHGFLTDDIVTISGTTNYDGTYKVTKVDANNFKITATWVSDDATGTASQEHFIDLTRNKIRFKHASKQTWQPAADDVVKGATSSATATVESVIVDTGTFAGTDANGTVIFKKGTVASGPFQDGEELQENGTPANIVGDADGANTDDEFTGDYTNFFWIENWDGIAYITNNYDAIQKFNGSYLTRLCIDLDVEGGPDNDVTRARLIFIMKSRIIILDTTEKGSNYRQRIRWCEASSPHIWKADSYLDADTNEWIITADFIGEDLIVFFESSCWKFSYTGNTSAPFRWDRIDFRKGSSATMSIVPLGKELYTVSDTEVITTNGREVNSIDQKIPDFMLEWNQNSVAYCYGFILDEERQSWLTYTSMSATVHGDGNYYPDGVLVLNEDDNSWATLKLPIHVIGYTYIEEELTWGTDITWEEADFSWEEKSLRSGYPISLFGGRDGTIYRLNYGGADNGSAIEFKAISGQWNPFGLDGYMARLGWIDFLVDTDENISFDVNHYINSEPTSIQTKSVICSGNGDKAWHRIYFNTVAEFHQIEITNNAISQRPRIHAAIPWFEKAGKII